MLIPIDFPSDCDNCLAVSTGFQFFVTCPVISLEIKEYDR